MRDCTLLRSCSGRDTSGSYQHLITWLMLQLCNTRERDMHMPSQSIEQLLSLLTETPPRLAALTADLSPQELQTRPTPDEWSANEVLAHLRACADVWGNCILAILSLRTCQRCEPSILAPGSIRRTISNENSSPRCAPLPRSVLIY